MWPWFVFHFLSFIWQSIKFVMGNVSRVNSSSSLQTGQNSDMAQDTNATEPTAVRPIGCEKNHEEERQRQQPGEQDEERRKKKWNYDLLIWFAVNLFSFFTLCALLMFINWRHLCFSHFHLRCRMFGVSVRFNSSMPSQAARTHRALWRWILFPLLLVCLLPGWSSNVFGRLTSTSESDEHSKGMLI